MNFKTVTVARSTTALKNDAPECFRHETHCEGALKRLRGRLDLCDVVLVVGGSGKRILAHRMVLIASSDYFSALLSGPMRESKEREITLNDVDGDALEQLINYCYTGCLEMRKDTIQALLTTANYLQLKQITEGCCEFIQRHLNPSNCLGVGFFADQLNLYVLLHGTKKFIHEKFEEVSNHTEFFLLTAEQLSELIASDDLHVPSEEFVFHFVVKWIEYEPQNRRKYFTDLLAQVRLPLLSPIFLVEKVEPLCNTTESQKLALNARKCHLMPREELSIQHRNSAKILLCIYESNNAQVNQNLELAGYSLRTSDWTIWNIPIKVSDEFAVALMGDNLMLVGGLLNGFVINTVTGINLHTMSTTEMAPLGKSRSGHSVAVLNGAIYAIGGYDEDRDLTSVERWNPVSRIWSFVAPMANGRYFAGVAVINGNLYVSGGNSGTNYLTSMECYDPIVNTWRSMAPMKVGRESHCLASHKGLLFAIGGNTRIVTTDIPIECYDPYTDKWTTIPCLPTICEDATCASLGPHLFLSNQSKIYMISSDVTCDNLKLQVLSTPDAMNFEAKLVAVPYEFSPS